MHPYLYTNPSEEALNEWIAENWNEAIDTHEYSKAFFFDYSISHDFPYRFFIQNYAITSDYLKYSVENVFTIAFSKLQDTDEKTLYAYSQPMRMTLKEFVDFNDSERGIGCYNALVVLLRLAYCLRFCAQFELVHNDIKMDNIMIPDENNPTDIRLIDFGESFIGFDQLSSSPVLKKGNVYYKYVLSYKSKCRAPELLKEYKDERVIDTSKADVWSLGVLAYSVSIGWIH